MGFHCVFRRTCPVFSLSTTRQHTHTRIRILLLCAESISIAIINTSIAAWHIKSLSKMPALHVLSTKWHSLLPALIPHSVIRAHLLQSLFSSFSTRCHCHNTVAEPLPLQTHASAHYHRLVQTSRQLQKPSTCLCASMPGKSYSLRGKKDTYHALSCHRGPEPTPEFYCIRSMRFKAQALSATLFPQCHYYATSVWMSSCRAVLHTLAATRLPIYEHTHIQHSR